MLVKKQLKEGKPPVICIVGPTASGKSALAEKVFNSLGNLAGGIINADARQVYRGLHTLTAAPEAAAHQFLYEFLKVEKLYSFAQYCTDADAVLAKIHAAKKVPVVVGGSGLYVDALLRRVATAPQTNSDIRAVVAKLNFEEQKKMLREKDPVASAVVDRKNPRRVMRALEVFLQTGQSITAFKKSEESPYQVFLIGWTQPREILRARIVARAELSWEKSVEEVMALLGAGHTAAEPGMKTIGVPEIISYLSGQTGAAEARTKIIDHTSQYARRQMTWFRRSAGLVWYNSAEEICHLVPDFLHKNSSQF